MRQQQLRRLVTVARGKVPADLILANARIVNTFNGGVEQGNVAICGGRIAGIGDYSESAETIDLGGAYLAPSLVNGHTHVESSMLHITQYAKAVVPHGTLAVVTDLHEIANVSGLDGAKQILEQLQRELDVEVGGVTRDRKFSLEAVRCLGACGLAPVMVVDSDTYGMVDPGRALEIVRACS